MTLPHRHDVLLAFRSIRSKKGQSFLTVLGIVIGIVSVVSIVDISQGVKHQVSGQINNFGKDLITVRAGQELQNTNGIITGLSSLSPFGNVTTLTQNDVDTVKSVPGIKESVPLTAISGQTTVLGGKPTSSLVIGAGDQLPDVINQSLAYGSFFDSSNDTTNVAVIGQSIADNLFGEDIPLGHQFSFHGQPFIVLGIFSQFANPPLSLNADFNNAIFIPYGVAEQLTNNSSPIDEILAKPTDPNNVKGAAAAINTSLLKVHSGQQDFSVLSQDQSLQVTGKVLNSITALIAIIAAISLLVGGVGIMNVTLVSVTDRTREIGIRKAIGATNRQILDQFVIEASVMSFTGGLIGIILSFVVDYVLRVTTNLQPIITWQIYVIATGVSLVVGIVFGTLPAFQAARKDPIEALRYE
jgi:putative ABC transport system permease protein